jgi:hypothetical protein
MLLELAMLLLLLRPSGALSYMIKSGLCDLRPSFILLTALS